MRLVCSDAQLHVVSEAGDGRCQPGPAALRMQAAADYADQLAWPGSTARHCPQVLHTCLHHKVPLDHQKVPLDLQCNLQEVHKGRTIGMDMITSHAKEIGPGNIWAPGRCCLIAKILQVCSDDKVNDFSHAWSTAKEV